MSSKPAVLAENERPFESQPEWMWSERPSWGLGPETGSVLRLARAIHMVSGDKGLKPGCHSICQRDWAVRRIVEHYGVGKQDLWALLKRRGREKFIACLSSDGLQAVIVAQTR